MSRAGRRPGVTGTREEIIAAARRLFAEKGYDGTTIRGIAAAAGVNPALVHHFFGSKQQVFAAALNFPFDPDELVQRIVAGPREEAGRRIVQTFLAAWGDPAARPALLALLRSVATTEQAATAFRQFAAAALLSRLSEALAVPAERLTAAIAQMVGLALLRYIVQVEPLAALGDGEVVALVAPVIQSYIDGASRE